MRVRIERHEDAALAQRLESTEFPRGPLEVAHRFQLDPKGHFVAVGEDGRPVGVAACVVYPSLELAWVGGMVVLPVFRRQGIARRLLDACTTYAEARGVRTVGLDATDEGGPLYQSAGFRAVGFTTRWQRVKAPHAVASPEFAVYPASGAELMEVAAFDRARFGANRAPWIAAVMHDHPGQAFVAYARGDGRLAGFVLGQQTRIGPLVADDESAAALLLQATERAGTPPVAELLDANASAARVFKAAGYSPTSTRCLRMIKGDALPGRPESQYAVGAWALG